ncbi:helix-turn-helix domain-containing protein [Nocardiopsis algeriensis]|uniref:DNA invertase Pin-like site-specific DNA recombinase n=1 Tax=Nocardiopsis algeriensis TaxID=1478215 RepID=A0A841IJY3_9ACTN|nr:helix-turn-helix domain-containing protein [Nocardiopsis algeriensis]MBB6119079.1 DNA invertase Pin-like site-specific DNA recombinase [Nocardiopsis algeriensis]
MDKFTDLADGGDRDPITELAALAELCADLERRKAVLVRRARNDGVTWAAIATVLGVSKQAVHKKYGRSRTPGER